MPYFRIALRADSILDYPPLRESIAFLDNFNLAYETLLLLPIDDVDFPYGYFDRRHSFVKTDQQLHILKLRQESPLELVAITTAVAGGVGALWGLVQIVEKISNWPLNREILKLQRDKLREELSKHQLGNADDLMPDIEQKMEIPRVGGFLRGVAARLDESPLKINAFEVTIINHMPPDKLKDRGDAPVNR